MVPERPGAVLEVRIHGVSGGAPADMLGQVPVELVAGDGLAGLVALGRAAYGNGHLRRIVGILWDIGQFRHPATATA